MTVSMDLWRKKESVFDVNECRWGDSGVDLERNPPGPTAG